MYTPNLRDGGQGGRISSSVGGLPVLRVAGPGPAELRGFAIFSANVGYGRANRPVTVYGQKEGLGTGRHI